MMDTPVGAGLEVLRYYMMYLKEKNPAKKQEVYHRFRQGLDILDLDALMYAMLGMNQNSMGYWLPIIADTVVRQGFFRIPKTTIVKVPITLLQLSRIDYERVNATTRRILDEFCKQAFHLDTAQDYFIKTGTYSSKFDFRNTHVQAGQEVNELGEYLLFIQNQACLMAGPLNTPSIYGASTTNEWVVREYIPDIEKNPTIYKGLPLHTEYRVFVDFDRGCVLGVNPYWDAATMKRRFSDASDANSPHMKHDYVIYCAHEDVLMRRYQENVGRVTEAVEKLAQEIAKSGALHGQWSMDIMQNGEDFWFIDMGWAQNSALKECVPKGLLRPSEEAWLPIDQLQALQEALSAEA